MVVIVMCVAGAGQGQAAQVVIGEESAVPVDSRQEWARYVRFRPGDGQTVTLNPPRMSWPYAPVIDPMGGKLPGDRVFTLQISANPDMSDPEVVIESTPINFYNFLPALEGGAKWYWRVCYDPGTDDEVWSDVRSFTLADDATVWDRSGLRDLRSLLRPHPRMIFTADSLDDILALRETDARSAELAEYVIAEADRVIEADWYLQFPEDDSDKSASYMNMCRGMVFAMFAHILTGDEKYAGYRERFLRVASWPKGGYASPEGAGAVGKWSSHVSEYLGLFYDWRYDDLSNEERAVVRGSLEWRLEHMIWNFTWKREDGKVVRSGSVAFGASSHPYENLMVATAGLIAIADESEMAMRGLEMTLNYLIGITNGHGEDEGWNEGPGYGNGKMKWLTDATWYAQTAIPELDLGKNEAYDAYCDFFARITPVGAQHTSFGNRGINESDWCSSRITNFRRMAMLTGNPVAMQNWLDTRRRLEELRGRTPQPFSPWIDYALPHYAREPVPAPEAETSRLFPLEGWVTVSSAPPSDYAAQKDAVSMTFHCRPRGGYSHSFRSENAFDIHAYGSTITCGGGTTGNPEWFANHTMSHNTVLIGGQEQLAAKEGAAPTYGRIVRYAEGDGYVYWAGDATQAYGEETGLAKFVRHVVFVDASYFVIYDELEMSEDAEPTTFQWLYHIYPAVDMTPEPEGVGLEYRIGDTEVIVRHLAGVDDLDMRDLRGGEGMINPITGEDVTRTDKWRHGQNVPGFKPLDAHHIWVGTRTPAAAMNFLVVIVPRRVGEEAPVIEGLGDTAVRVSFRGETRTVSFADLPEADIIVKTR
jgi:hypothetical protein